MLGQSIYAKYNNSASIQGEGSYFGRLTLDTNSAILQAGAYTSKISVDSSGIYLSTGNKVSLSFVNEYSGNTKAKVTITVNNKEQYFLNKIYEDVAGYDKTDNKFLVQCRYSFSDSYSTAYGIFFNLVLSSDDVYRPLYGDFNMATLRQFLANTMENTKRYPIEILAIGGRSG